MKKNVFLKRGQSVTEYAILLGVVIAVFAGMQLYVKRGLNSKIKAVTNAATGAGDGAAVNMTDDEGNTLSLNIPTAKQQYEPYYAESQSNTFSQSEDGSSMTNGALGRSSKSISGQAKGSYKAEKAAADDGDASTTSEIPSGVDKSAINGG